MSNILTKFLKSQKRENSFSFKIGDIIKVYQEIEEGGKKRIQPFDGLVISKKHGTEPGATFTVRKKISGIGTEKIFPLHSPTIKKVEIIKKAKRITKSKLYWTRERTDREIQRRLRFEQAPKTEPVKKETNKKKEKEEKEKKQ